MGKMFRVLGPPGTGKTTYLTRELKLVTQKYGAHNVIVSSFTRAAAAELAGRNAALKRRIGTLHSHAYSTIRSMEVAAGDKLADFNENFPQYKLAGGIDNEDVGTIPRGKGSGDELMSRMNVYRARMIPKEQWAPTVQAFHKAWTDWKRSEGLVDFSDMIEIALSDADEAPGEPEVGFFDEAQDFTPLEMALVRKWTEKMEYSVLAGDDDQCHPAGTMVSVKGRPVPIERLRDGDKVDAYSRMDSVVYRKGYPAKVANRTYSGLMYKFRADGRDVEATYNHKWFVRWNYEKTSDKYCTYVMEKTVQGEKVWRVGWCKLFNTERGFHLGLRARLEKAEKAWVLKIFDNKADASLEESFVAANFGISTMPFLPHGKEVLYTQANLEQTFLRINKNPSREYPHQSRRVEAALLHYGRSLDFPFWEQSKTTHYGSPISIFRSCNILPEIMLLPVPRSRGIEWTPFCMETRMARDEKVYSLDVEKYHSYVANGIVTHNCLYAFLGATPKTLTEGSFDHTKVLDQSYRVPRKVQGRAEAWIGKVSERVEKEYNPRDEEGEVVRSRVTLKNAKMLTRKVEEDLDAGLTVMILTTCSYMLHPILAEFRKQGIPFANRYRVEDGAWNPLKKKGTAGAVSDFLLPCEDVHGERSRLWTPKELHKTINILKSKDVLTRGIKKDFKGMFTDEEWVKEIPIEVLMKVFPPESSFWDVMDRPDKERMLSWMKEHLLDTRKKVAKYPMKVIEKCGTLPDVPKTTVGTIHSVKGGQADSVYLFPDLSTRGAQSYSKHGESKDSVIRAFYVGMTRAKQKLTLCHGAGYSVKW